MKISTLTILFIFYSVFLHGMEKPLHEKDKVSEWIYQVLGSRTNIILKKGNIYDLHQSVDCIVVGKGAERQLSGERFNMNKVVMGRVEFDRNGTVWEKNESAESDSDDDTYKPFHPEYGLFLKHAHTKQIVSVICKIEEPRLHQNSYLGEKYFAYYTNEGVFGIETAEEDLVSGYKNLLEQVSRVHSIKSIAIPVLSTEIGFPGSKAAPIAVRSVFDFSRTDSGISEIYLVVKKRSDFNLYKKWLQWLENLCK